MNLKRFIPRRPQLFALFSLFSLFSIGYCITGDHSWLGFLGFLGFLGCLAIPAPDRARQYPD